MKLADVDRMDIQWKKLFQSIAAVGLFGAGLALAVPMEAYVTGEAPGAGNVIFRVKFDPTVAASATVSIAVTDTRRLDGIDFLPGSKTKVSVGAQTPILGGGDIAGFDLSPAAPLPILPNFVTGTGPGTRPSTVLNHGGYVYYIENQFGFGGGVHRIMRTPIGGPVGTTEVVFAPAPGSGIVNLEGLEIAGGRLYFFSADPVLPLTARALNSIALNAAGVSDGTPAVKHKGALTASPDGADELDRDPLTGYIFGTNIITGEVIYWDPAGLVGGALVSLADLAAPASADIARFKTAMFDGIRATGDGYLVLTGLDGVIASIHIAGALAGLDPLDVKILFDGKGFSAAPGIGFDDLTPLVAVPVPTTAALLALGLLGLARTRHRKSEA